MKIHLLVLHFLASALATTVRSKPHSNHQNLAPLDEPQDSQKILSVLKEADPEQEEVLPTSITFEDDSQEQENADISYHKSEVQLKEARSLEDKSAPILLREKVLAGDLLEVSEEEEEEDEDQNADQDRVAEEGTTKERSEERDGDSSTESEISTDMDYAGDSHDLESQDNPLEHKKEVKPLIDADSEILPTEGSESVAKIPVSSDYEPEEGEGAEMIEGSLAEQDNEPVAEREDLEEMTSASREEGQNEDEGRSNDTQEPKNNAEFEEGPNSRQAVVGGEEEERNRNDSVTYSKGKDTQKKDQRAEKPSEILDEEKQGFQQKGSMEKETDLVESTAQDVNKRKTGESATLAGLNPVQIRANEELYPFERESLDESTQEALVNPCANFRCKRGKTCKVSDKNEPSCFCQDPTFCAPSTTEIENVCGTDNKTYDTSCALFATKCKLEGTKRGHQLQLDYTGRCKYIAPCQEGELLQFPLRMRDWLKNVLLQLYERDMRAPGFLLPKQRARVQKIYESERRLHGDDHPIELLIRDFQKNYHMYIYPVHWQFAQLDQHPADRFLSHSELAPLRVPLVPMEHCTSLFFKQCDADKDRLVSFKEWGNCFGIKDEDVDLNLLI